MQIARYLALCGWAVLAAQTAYAQAGCTDPAATNYNPAAVANAGTCQYTIISAAPSYRAPDLPAALVESSGLIYWRGLLLSHGDSGNPPALYGLDTASHTVRLNITVSNYPNVDWEELTQDSLYIYIGEFGNNNGNRRDLKVLRIAKAGLPAFGSVSVQAEAIAFAYQDQTSFASGSNNFDCEAMVSVGDSLWLFTKGHQDSQTSWYTLPKTPGTYTARKRATLAVGYLVTGAAHHPSRPEVALLGYGQLATYLTLLTDYGPAGPFSGNVRRINLTGSPSLGQTEGLTYLDGQTLYISNEKVTLGPITILQRLWRLGIGAYTDAAYGYRQQPQAVAPAHSRPYSLRHISDGYIVDSKTTLHILATDGVGRRIMDQILPAGTHLLSLPASPQMVLLRIEAEGRVYTDTLLRGSR